MIEGTATSLASSQIDSFLPPEQSDVKTKAVSDQSSNIAEVDPNKKQQTDSSPANVNNSQNSLKTPSQDQDQAVLLDPQAKAEKEQEQKQAQLMTQLRAQAEKQRQMQESEKAQESKTRDEQNRIDESRRESQNKILQNENDRAEQKKEEERAAFFEDLETRISSVKEAFIQTEFIGKGELINKLA